MIYEPLKILLCVELLQKSIRKSFANNRPSKRKSVDRKRLALTPETTALLVEEGHRVYRKRSRQGINYPDNSYADAGAEIVDTHSEIMQADLIIKYRLPHWKRWK